MRLHSITRLVLGLLVLSIAVSTAFWFTPQGERLLQEWQTRSTQELVRYLLRRLEGHPKLEAVLLPPLHWIQRRHEREPMLITLPTLGKGQQTTGSLTTSTGIVREWSVASSQEIRQALLQAKPGTRIVIEPGLYMFNANLYQGFDGAVDAPIVLSANRTGSVWLEFAQPDGVLITRPHWTFENLNIRGTCKEQHYCEHAFHVVGRGFNTVIRNNMLVDFNAHIKVNGEHENWPDHGVVSQNTLLNRGARNTDRPVTPIDLVGANYWQVSDNVIANFVKLGGNQVSYGMFMKGASEGGRFERNLVICSPTAISQPGIRVGLSFGAGETGPPYCRDKSCSAFEHRRGLAANNIVAHCNDTGIDVNRSQDITLLHNTLINTSGIALRGRSQSFAQSNLYEGVAVSRGASELKTRWNQKIHAPDWFIDADALNLTWRKLPDSVPTAPQTETDFAGNQRHAGSMPGALN